MALHLNKNRKLVEYRKLRFTIKWLLEFISGGFTIIEIALVQGFIDIIRIVLPSLFAKGFVKLELDYVAHKVSV